MMTFFRVVLLAVVLISSIGVFGTKDDRQMKRCIQTIGVTGGLFLLSLLIQ